MIKKNLSSISSKPYVFRKTYSFIKNAICIFVIIAWIFLFYRCPFKLIFGIDCPGCGMTRALISVLHLDFIAAFSYHQLFFIPITGIFYQIFRKKFKLLHRFELCATLLILLAIMIRWLVITFVINK